MMSIQEAALRLGLTPSAVYKLCRAGCLPYYRLGPRGGKVLLKPDDVADYLESCRVETPSGSTLPLKHLNWPSPGSPPPKAARVRTGKSTSI